MKKENKRHFEFKVDVKSAVPVYEQVKRAIKIVILAGYLKDGDKLMSLRELAMKLQINPNTIIKVYSQLENEGYIYSRPGSGYFVKLDKERAVKGKYEIFKKETMDYISTVIELGYLYDDILKILKEYFKGEKNDKD